MEILQQALPIAADSNFATGGLYPMALFTAFCALMVVGARNLFHNALALVGTLFGVAGIYALLEARFLAVSQILVYVGAISTLITFAIMLTRGMMYGAFIASQQAGWDSGDYYEPLLSRASWPGFRCTLAYFRCRAWVWRANYCQPG